MGSAKSIYVFRTILFTEKDVLYEICIAKFCTSNKGLFVNIKENKFEDWISETQFKSHEKIAQKRGVSWKRGEGERV